MGSLSPSVLVQPTGRTSPLRRFGEAKKRIFRTFGLIKDRITEIERFLIAVHEGEAEDEEKGIDYLLKKTAGIEEVLARDHMKVFIIYLIPLIFLRCINDSGRVLWTD